jgi:putative tricarboxylic transport membrane protein
LKKLNQDHIIGAVCIILAVVILVTTRSFPKATTGASDLTGPSFYPNLLAYLFIICGLYEIIGGFRKQEGRKPFDLTHFWDSIRKPGPLNILLTIALILFFIFLMEALGFMVCSYIILFILMWRFGVPLFRNIVYSAIFVLLLNVIFAKIFTIYLPSGILDYLGL